VVVLDTTVILSVVGSAGVTTLVTVVNGWVTRGADGRKEKTQRRRETLRGTKATLEELLRLATMPIDSRRAPGGRNAYAENLLDPQLFLPHVTRAIVHYSAQGGWRFVDAVRELHTAMKLSPGSDIAHLDLARILHHLGWVREAQDELQEASRIDPLSNEVARLAAINAWFGGHPREALGQFGQIPKQRVRGMLAGRWQILQIRLQLESPKMALVDIEAWVREEPAPFPLAFLALARARLGSHDINELEQRVLPANQEVGHFHHVLHLLAEAHAQMKDTRRAVEYLRRASETGFPCLACFDYDPLLAPLHGTPEYAALRVDLHRTLEESRASLRAGEPPTLGRAP
jgi:hypothetical protein